MKVLSLFDGISCGRVALERAGIPVERYVAFETDPYAVQISRKNYPDIIHYANVFYGDYSEFEGFDLLIGGSPCTYWSIAKQGRETTSDGIGFKLFMEYVRALRESKCKYFLYENNASIHRNIKDEISKYLRVQPIMIDSALVSAQQRKRCYRTNIPNVTQPEDKGIFLKDILLSGIPWNDKSYCFTATYNGAEFRNTLERKQRTMIAEPVILNEDNGKARTIKAQYHKTSLANTIRQDGFGSTMVAVPVRIGQIGKGGQGQRIYSVCGKSVSLSANGGGQGAKTGLYKIDLPDGDYIIRKLYPIEAERLQTLPDNYTEGISNAQRYKCIGNGWTVDVIAHILGRLHNEDAFYTKILDMNNYAIFDGYAKAQNVIQKHNTAVCSISGGSDSDIVLDIIHNVDVRGKVTYFWIDTGLEYTATKEHIDYLEQKYGITIERVKAVKPIPVCVREYGVPFLSKYVSEQMMRLQAHGFKWEDKPLQELLAEYPNCKTALQWWSNACYSDEKGEVKMSRFSIGQNKWLKEFIMQNPPDFPISNKCCEYAKKKPAKLFIKEKDADLDITGIRKSEGGIRSVNYKSCFSTGKEKGCDTYRPIFWYKDLDKRIYEQHFDITHSRCYSEYGLKRTGCVGCPYSPNIVAELEVIQKYEPRLYDASVNIFGKSYEYSSKYREFRRKMDGKSITYDHNR